MNSEICLPGSVSAMRLGIMKGTLDEGLASANNSRPVGSFSLMTIVLSFGAVISDTKPVKTFWPSESLADQRFSDCTQSAAVTGWPSCHSRPSRSVIV